MGKKKQTTTQVNTYGSPAPFSSPATVRLQELANQAQGPDPSIRYAYSARRENSDNSFKNPLGAYTSAATQDAASRVTSNRLGMDEQEAIKQSNFQAGQAQFNRQLGVVGATMPFQTGGTTTQTQSGGLLGQILSSAAQIGSTALTKGCWVAESVYGTDDPRTHIMRSWVNREMGETWRGKVVRTFYFIFGRLIARVSNYSPRVNNFLRVHIFNKALPHAIDAVKRRNNGR
jgi:hypothetical protein